MRSYTVIMTPRYINRCYLDIWHWMGDGSLKMVHERSNRTRTLPSLYHTAVDGMQDRP